MAQDKDDRRDDRSAGSAKRPGESGDERRASPLGGRPASKASANGGAHPDAAKRRRQYLIGARQMPGIQGFGFQPQPMEAIADYLSGQDGVEILRRIKPSGLQPFGRDRGVGEALVVRIDEGKAESLKVSAQPQIILEHDALLRYADADASCLGWAASGAAVALSSTATNLVLRVVGDRDQPLAKASVLVYGPGLPAQAVTDESGTARLVWFGGPVDSIQAIYVRPAANHWDRLIVGPELDAAGTHTIKLRPLSETWPNFPNERLVGWGQRLMRLDQVGGKLTGAGVRVGIIDSGCDTSHPLLRHIVRGKDYANGGSETGWTDDMMANGTHCTGIIAGAATGAQGIASFAPEAEVHVFKVFPGGRLSDLLAALDECIARELDIVHISVGCDEMSELVGQKLHEARQRGIACIVAAGNSNGPVQFPGILPSVLTVGAVGKLQEFPRDTGHALSTIPHLIGNDGVFATRFSCFGPQVAVSAPGVAVVSAVPGGYAALDGTSVAAAHVTGLAAIILAHHPLFQAPLRTRSEQRVASLFGLVQASAVPRFADPLRGGAGVPDVLRVPGLYGTAAAQPYFANTAPNLPAGAFGSVLGGMAQSVGSDPFTNLMPPLGAGSPAGVQGWQQTLMHMRAAGLI
jgi:subtilisin family serine protease